jgi:hypothetical protein
MGTIPLKVELRKIFIVELEDMKGPMDKVFGGKLILLM